MTPAASRAGGRRYVLDANALLGFFEARHVRKGSASCSTKRDDRTGRY